MRRCYQNVGGAIQILSKTTGGGLGETALPDDFYLSLNPPILYTLYTFYTASKLLKFQTSKLPNHLTT